jgi:hypothetical protein
MFSTLLLAEQPVSNPNATKVARNIGVTLSPAPMRTPYDKLCVGSFCDRGTCWKAGIDILIGPPAARRRSVA